MNGDKKKKPKLGSVRSVEQQLYAKNAQIKEYERYGFHPDQQEHSIQTTWQDGEEQQPVGLIEKQKKTSRPMTGFTKLLLVSILFFLFSLGAAFMVFYLNSNEVEYNAVQLSVVGPNSVAGGEELEFDIVILNNNPVPLVLSDVVVNYPQGTITADEQGLSLEKDITSIEEIRSGFQETVKFNGVLFGQPGDTKDITIVFQYRVPDSDNIFFKERVYQVALESAPVALLVDHNNSFQNADEVEIVLDVVSNANSTLRNLFVSVDYPFGFEFASSVPVGLDSSSFAIEELLPGETKQILITGVVRGQDGEQRTIRYSLGAEDKTRPGHLGTVLAVQDSTIAIRKPPIALQMTANGNNGSVVVVQPGETVDYLLSYTNSLLTKLLDNTIWVGLEGSAYDPRAVRVEDGLYRSSDRTISWTANNRPFLSEIEPGLGGDVSFSLQTPESSVMTGVVENPELLLQVRGEATNFEIGGEEERVSHEIVKRIKVATEPAVSVSLLHSIGPLDTAGPMVPVVGEETVYTLLLQARNTTNTMRDVAVTATLPRYVSLREALVPQDANIEYSDRDRTITWSIDSLSPGVGYTRAPQEVYLSVAFDPSLDQVGNSPVLVQDIAIGGIDTFTDITVNNTAWDIDTNLIDDPAFVSGTGNVREATLE